MKPLTFNNSSDRFKLPGDRAMFNRIAVDMIEHGRELAPSSHWNWNLGLQDKEKLSGYTDELFDEKYSKLELMLEPWVGVTGMQSLKMESVIKYEDLLRSIDHLELLPAEILSHGHANGWLETDLGSVMDVNLIAAYLVKQSKKRFTICEVGGGYGRLAETLITVLLQSAHYVLVDAVPGSLMYAYLYLKKQLPNLRIGSFYNDDVYSRDFDVYIMPAWQVQQLPSASFDICINVESMQEMEQHHVDYYLKLFDRLAISEGLIYMSNARDYVFLGEWKIPTHWEPLFFNNTPRSWTADHPTQVYRKHTGDFSREQQILESIFKQQITAWRNHQHINELELRIFEYCQKIKNLNDKVNRLQTRDPVYWFRSFLAKFR